MNTGTRKNNTFIPYDYEKAYEKSLEDLAEFEVEQMIKRGKPKIVYATKEIRSGEQLEIEIYPEFTRRDAAQIPAGCRLKKDNRKAMNNLNDKNSRKACERIINTNFGTHDIWMTLTYRDSDLPQDFEHAQRNIQNYMRKVNYWRKKEGLPNAKYVYITEWLEAEEDGGTDTEETGNPRRRKYSRKKKASNEIRCHHHVIIDGAMSMDRLEELWKHGSRNETRRLSKDEYGLSGMANYITKQPRRKHIKKWCASKGLEQPQENKNHYKFNRKKVENMVRDHAMIQTYMEKWYSPKGYIFTDAKIYYNEVNAQFYISARMRKPEKMRN